MESRKYVAWVAALTIAALLVREWHVLSSFVADPVRGDVEEYLAYALNLATEGTFSRNAHQPDAFRSPGYPLFLAAIYKFSGNQGWYAAIYHAQALLGALTVTATISFARQWLPRGWSLLPGGMLAIWPHHIAATNAMLLEVVFGFALVIALLLTSLALTKRSTSMSVYAGIVFGCSYLINPVVALFPLALVALFWREQVLRQGVILALVSLVAVGGWEARNAAQEAQGGDRASINFVQGAWPDYHSAWRVQASGYKSHTAEAIRNEISLFRQDRAAGLHAIGDRVRSEPVRYALWYAIQKPYLLWAWDIRIGWGGIYTVHPENSPLEEFPVLAATTASTWILNPMLFVLAAAVAVASFRLNSGPQSIAALFFLYITAVHVVLQAEPRYSIAYKPVELILAVSALTWLAATYERRSRLRLRRLRSATSKLTHSVTPEITR